MPVVPTVAKLWAALNLRNAVMFNVVLAVFNMIPLPPLDGGRVAVGLLPRFLAYPLARLERYGILIVVGVLFLLPWLGREAGVDLDIVGIVIYWPANMIVRGHQLADRSGMTEAAAFEEDRRGVAPEGAELVVDLEGYEGPIDVLLTLAREQKVDLTKISILALADQYLAFIAAARHLKLEIAADYLVMAAWLAYLKSRLLLPGTARPRGAERRGTRGATDASIAAA